MTLTATKIKMPYWKQLPNQLPPGSNFIRKQWVAKQSSMGEGRKTKKNNLYKWGISTTSDCPSAIYKQWSTRLM